MIGHGYSLWLRPRGTALARLSELVRELSEIYKTPRFPPHVTLLARISQSPSEIVARTRALARQCGPFQLELDRLELTPDYFQSLFIRVVPNRALEAAHWRARELFGASLESFMPHLSVLYGDLPETEKQAVIARLNGWPTRFTVEAIDVYATEGQPEDWRLVESVALD